MSTLKVESIATLCRQRHIYRGYDHVVRLLLNHDAVVNRKDI